MARSTGVATPTRERIVDEAMRLFGQNGFRGTSVIQIEQAAGLSPGAGGLYHHFSSKDEILNEGVRRHLARLEALRDVRALLTNLGDLRAELTIAARFFLQELDNETELFRILATESRRRPDLLSGVANQVIASTYEGFADWLQASAKPRRISKQKARAVATIALGALLSGRLLRDVMGVPPPADDEEIIPVWVDMVMSVVTSA